MKKFVYLFGMILLNLNMMAQIDLGNGIWELVVIENFDTPARTWITNSFLSSDDFWRAYPGHGVTNKDYPMIYQFTQCHFNDTDEVMELVSEYHSQITNNDYYLPQWMWLSQGGPGYPNNENLFFFTGSIDYVNYNHYTHTIDKFLYGYFEIRCKLPIHNGSWPAFWLFGNGPDTYEEIDILEYTSHSGCDGDPLRGYSFGIWHNPNGTNYVEDGTNDGAHKFFEDFHHILTTDPDLRQYHTYGCEWMPDYVRWYCDGNIVAEYNDIRHIPQYPKTLKINYDLKDYALDNTNHPDGWSGSDVMTIDYVKVYKLKTDCETDEYITTGTQFANYDRKMKHSITIGSLNGSVIVPSNTDVSMRANDFIQIDGEFEIPVGSQMTLSVHECPLQNNVVSK